MARVEQVLAAIDAIYETTAAPQLWPCALQSIADCFEGARGTVLIVQGEAGNLTTVVSPALADAHRDYDEGWWREDFFTLRGIERGVTINGSIWSERDLASPEEMATHPFCIDFRRKHGLGSFLAAMISPSPKVNVFLSVQGVLDGPPFTRRSMDLLDQISRHCERALLLSCQVDALKGANDALAEALRQLGCGVLLVNTSGAVMVGNESASEMLSDGLKIVAGKLVGSDSKAFPELEAATATVLSDETRLTCPRPIIIRRSKRSRPLIAYVLPVRGALSQEWMVRGAVSAAILLFDRPDGAAPDPALLRDYLGVTLSEARVASRIGQGLSPRETAQSLGISEETVRTALKRIFSKTGIARQSELSAVVAGLPTLVPGEDRGTSRPPELDSR